MYKEVFLAHTYGTSAVPNNPLNHLNSYLINSDKRKVFIDVS